MSTPVKCISLYEPWATLLLVNGELGKRYETRSWRTHYRGRLYIHASARWSREQSERWHEFRESLQNLSPGSGHVLGHVDLMECITTEDALQRGLSEREIAFGDYGPGRYAFRLTNPVRLKKPVPARGKLNIWTWIPPEGWMP